MAVTALVFDQTKPARLGNTGFAVLTGQFADANTINTAAFYTDALAAVAGHFQTSPTPRVTALLITGTTYAFIAVGRAV